VVRGGPISGGLKRVPQVEEALVPTGYRQTTEDQDHLVFFKKADSTRAGTR